VDHSFELQIGLASNSQQQPATASNSQQQPATATAAVAATGTNENNQLLYCRKI